MKLFALLILTCLILTANNSLHAISPAKIFNNVKNKVSSWIYQQEEVIKQDVKCPTQKKLVIENSNGNIKIKTWKQDGISLKMIKRAFSSDDLQKLTVSIDTSDKDLLFIKTKAPHNIINCCIDYELLIPQDFSLRCATGHGNIKVKRCDGTINAMTDDGTIELQNTVGKVCSTTNSHGSITIKHACGPIQASVNNGNILIDEANNSVEATTSNGMIALSATSVRPNSSIRLTASGSIEIKLPQNTNARVLANSENGRVISDHLITIESHATKLNKTTWNDIKHKVEGTMGTGNAEIILQAQDGSIKILETEKKA